MNNEDAPPLNTNSGPEPAAKPFEPPAPDTALPPTIHRLYGRVINLDATEHLRGSLARFGAKYEADAQRIHIWLETVDYNSIHLQADHAHARAGLTTMRSALHDVARLQFGFEPSVTANFEHITQVNCRRCEPWFDDELRFECLPHRNLILLAARFSDADNSSEHYTVHAYLTRTEGEALFYHLERGLADLERFEGVGG